MSSRCKCKLAAVWPSDISKSLGNRRPNNSLPFPQPDAWRIFSVTPTRSAFSIERAVGRTCRGRTHPTRFLVTPTVSGPKNSKELPGNRHVNGVGLPFSVTQNEHPTNPELSPVTHVPLSPIASTHELQVGQKALALLLLRFSGIFFSSPVSLESSQAFSQPTATAKTSA